MSQMYDDFQIMSLDVMERMARAYYENKINLTKEKDQEGDHLLISLFCLLKKLRNNCFQKRKIIEINNIISNISSKIVNNNANFEIDSINNISSENILIRKIILKELEIIDYFYHDPKICKTHILNIKRILSVF